MKASGVFLCLLLFLCLLACEQNEEAMVDIPDAAFLEALIQEGADKDGDGLISEKEAALLDSLDIGPFGITDLTGLAAMTALRSLEIHLNPLEGLDISQNHELKHLSCTSCQLFELDVSQNPGLEKLFCGRNYLDELDVSANVNLTHLACNNNLLDSMELGLNTDLSYLITCGNRFPFLDLSHNTLLRKIGIDNMPMLEAVLVWTLPFPPAGVEVLMDYSPSVRFYMDFLAR